MAIRDDCNISNKLKKLEGLVPSGEGVGVSLPREYNVIPDPVEINKVINAFSVVKKGTIPPDGLVIILHNGDYIPLGPGGIDDHANIIMGKLHPRSSRPERTQMFQDWINSTGSIKGRADGAVGGNFSDVIIYRPLTPEQRGGIKTLFDKDFGTPNQEMNIALYDGATPLDDALLEFTIKDEKQMLTVLRKIENNPPREWDAIISAGKGNDREIIAEIKSTKNQVARGEGLLPDEADEIYEISSGKKGTLLRVNEGNVEVQWDNMPEGATEFLNEDAIRFADDIGEPQSARIFGEGSALDDPNFGRRGVQAGDSTVDNVPSDVSPPAAAGGGGKKPPKRPTKRTPPPEEQPSDKNVEDLTPEEFKDILDGEVDISPLTDDAVDLLRRLESTDPVDKLILNNITNEEIEGIRKIIAKNGIETYGRSLNDLVESLKNKRNVLAAPALDESNVKLVQDARSKYDEAIQNRIQVFHDTNFAPRRAQVIEEEALAKKAWEATKAPKKVTKETLKLTEAELLEIRTNAEKLRKEADKIRDSLTDPKNKTPIQERFEEMNKIYREAEDLEIEAGIPRLISSVTSRRSSVSEHIVELKELLEKSKKAPKNQRLSKERVKEIKSDIKVLEAQVEKHYKIQTKGANKVEQLEDKIRRSEQIGDSRTPKQLRNYEKAKEELEFAELALVHNLEESTGLEQIKYLQDLRAKYIKMSESNLSQKDIDFFTAQAKKIERTIGYLELKHGKKALESEQSQVYKELTQQSFREHEEEFILLEKELKQIEREIIDITTYRMGVSGEGNKLADLYAKQSVVVKKVSEMRENIFSGVEAVMTPAEGGRILTHSDMELTWAGRGWRGKAWERFMSKEFRNPVIKGLMGIVRSPFNAYDPSFMLGGDRWGKLIIAHAKMENYAIQESILDAHTLAALGDNPFKRDKDGILIIEGKRMMMDELAINWEKYKGKFGDIEDSYITTILKVRKSAQNFMRAQGADLPDIWDEIDVIFRDVLYKTGKDIGKVNPDEIHKRLNRMASGGGGRPSAFKKRVYESMLDGYDNGLVYDQDIAKVMIQKVMALRRWSVHDSFLRRFADEKGFAKEQFVEEELKHAKAITTKQSEWANLLYDYARGSWGAPPPGGGPKKPFLKAFEKYGEDGLVPEDIQKLMDEIAAINRDKKLDRFEKNAKIGTQTGKNEDGSVKKATGLMIDVEKLQKTYGAFKNEAIGKHKEALDKVKSHLIDNVDGTEVILVEAPIFWPTLNNKLFRIEDITYLEKHWGPTTNDTVKALGKAGTLVSSLRIIQTGFDFGGMLINLLPAFGHDMYRGFAAVPTALINRNIGDLNELKAFPAFSIIGDSFAGVLKAMKVPEDVITKSGIRGESIWAKTSWNSFTAFFNKKASSRWWVNEASKNPEIWARFKKHARVGGLPHEFGEFSTFEKFEKAVPLLRNLSPVARFQRHFTQSLTGAAWLYFKSLDHLADDVDKLEKLGAMTRNIVGVHSGQELGIHAGQLGVERLLFYAPSFTRASFAIMANAAFQPTTFSGRQALKSIAGLSAAMTMMVGTYSMTKQMEANGFNFNKIDWDSLGEDIKDSWNPSSGKFWGMRVGNGIVGLGGAMRSNMSLIMRIIGTGIEWNPTLNEPLNGFKLKAPNELIPDNWNHPFARWFRGKGSIPVGTAWNIFSGEDFLGYTVDETNPLDVLSDITPFWAQAMAESRLGWKGKAGIFLTEILGARYYDINRYKNKQEKWENATGMTWDEIQEKTVTADGSERKVNQRLITALENNDLPEGLGFDQETWDEAYEAHLEWEEDRRKKDSDFQALDDTTDALGIEQGRELADFITSIDGSKGSGVEPVKRINEKRTYYSGQFDLSYKLIIGDSGEELETNDDISKLEPVAQLLYALEIDNFRNLENGEIDWDGRQELIDSIVPNLSPLNRELFLRHDSPVVGTSDVENYKAGKYDAANEGFRRKAEASDAYQALEEAPKYKGMTHEEGESLEKLLDTIDMVRTIYQIQGRDFDRRDILRNINELLPGNKIVQYAIISTYPALKHIILSTEREEIMMDNPDLMVFWPYLMNYGFSDDFVEEWEERWGFGRNVWPGYQDPPLSETLAELEEDARKANEKGGGILGTGIEVPGLPF